jgi:hypothetical protein
MMYKMFGCFAGADRGGGAMVEVLVLSSDGESGIEFKSGAIVAMVARDLSFFFKRGRWIEEDIKLLDFTCSLREKTENKQRDVRKEREHLAKSEQR